MQVASRQWGGGVVGELFDSLMSFSCIMEGVIGLAALSGMGSFV